MHVDNALLDAITYEVNYRKRINTYTLMCVAVLHHNTVVSAATSLTPTLKHVISGGDFRWVVGVTSVDSHLFVLRSPSQQEIQAYDAKSFKQRKAPKVIGLSDDTRYSGLTSCVTNKCLYVSDWLKDNIYKVELSRNNYVSCWRVDSSPHGLSMNAACNLIVACEGACKIQEYNTTSGTLVREIRLDLSDTVLCPYHAVQLTSDRFVVSNQNATSRMCDVVEVDTKEGEGRVVVSYCNQLKSTTHGKFSWPRHLSVDENKKFIFVADKHNDGIVILNRSLGGCARELNVKLVEGGLQSPSCLYFNASLNRLVVGEYDGRCQVRVIDNVI